MLIRDAITNIPDQELQNWCHEFFARLSKEYGYNTEETDAENWLTRYERILISRPVFYNQSFKAYETSKTGYCHKIRGVAALYGLISHLSGNVYEDEEFP